MLIPDTINVLYIEDDKSSSSIMVNYLHEATHTKFNLVHMCTLKEGLEYLSNECSDVDSCGIDVILLDLILPNSQGVDTYKQVANQCGFIPIVIISSHEEMACECVKLGAQDYLIKPEFSGGVITRSLKYAVERNKLETSKMESERKYREVINSTPIGFHSYELRDDELYFVGYNPAANNILNVDNELFMGKTIQEGFPNLANTEIPDRYIEVAKTGKPWNGGIIEYEDENVNQGFFRVNVFQTSQNNITVSFEDMTKQILISRKFQNLVEITKAGIYEIDFIQNKFVYVNEVLCQQLGYTQEELMGMGPYEILTEDSVERWFKRWEALQRGEWVENSFEYEAIRKDGSHAWALITAEYVEDDNKNIIGANVVAIDITDRKLIELKSKQKEEMIFSELENKIHEWKEEIVVQTQEKEIMLNTISLEIQSFDREVIS